MRLPFRYLISQTPWALASTLAGGFANYLIVVLLANAYGEFVVGEFRLLLSISAILGIFSLMDTGKVLLKSIVSGNGGVTKPLLVNRIRFSFLGVLIGFAISYYYFRAGNEIYMPMMVASLLVPIIFPAMLYESICHAKKDFRTNAIYDVTKFSVITAIFVGLTYLAVNPSLLLSLYFVVVAIFNMVFCWRLVTDFRPFAKSAKPETRDSISLSASSAFTYVLQHADKLLISYFLGIETLGLYAIGISTGNLVMFSVKPALTVLNPLLVKERFSGYVLGLIFILGTVGGVIAGIALEPLFIMVFGAERLASYELSRIMIWGLGIYGVGIILYNTAVYNEDSPIRVPVLTNFISPVVILVYLVISVLFGGDYALLLCALSYPLRHLMNVLVLSIIGTTSASAAHV